MNFLRSLDLDDRWHVVAKGGHCASTIYFVSDGKTNLVVKHYADFVNVPNQFTFISQLHQAGIRTPEPIRHRDRYGLFEHVDATNLEDALPALTQSELVQMGSKMATLQRCLLSIHGESFGSMNSEPFSTWMGYLAAQGYPQFGASTEYTSSPCACHYDFHPTNLLIDATGELYVIDFDLLIFGDPQFDIAHTRHWLQLNPAKKALLEGYDASMLAAGHTYDLPLHDFYLRHGRIRDEI